MTTSSAQSEVGDVLPASKAQGDRTRLAQRLDFHCKHDPTTVAKAQGCAGMSNTSGMMS